MNRRIVLAGCAGIPTTLHDDRIVRITPQDVSRPLPRFVGLGILGPDALARIRPADARLALGLLRDCTVLCTEPQRGVDLALWAREGFDDVVAPGKLDDLLRRCLVATDRPKVDPERWLPQLPIPGSDAARAVATLQTLTDLAVAPWAAALHRSRRTLHTWCRAAFGMSPGRLLRRYRAEVVLEVLALGGSIDDCCVAAQLGDRRSIRRLLRAFGLTAPVARAPRGHGR